MPDSILSDHDLTLDRHPQNIFVLTLRKAPENRLNSSYCQRILVQIRLILSLIPPNEPGCLITTSFSSKFFCTGLELDEADRNPYANSEGFYPLLAALLDFPYPTIAVVTGHVFGGGCPFMLAHDYRIMNADRGFVSMPPVDLGLHFPGIGALPRLKLAPATARKMLLEAHRWTGKQALEEGIVDTVAAPGEMLDVAMRKAEQIAGKGKMGVYSLLRNELYGEAARQLRDISYVRGRRNDQPARAKI